MRWKPPRAHPPGTLRRKHQGQTPQMVADLGALRVRRGPRPVPAWLVLLPITQHDALGGRGPPRRLVPGAGRSTAPLPSAATAVATVAQLVPAAPLHLVLIVTGVIVRVGERQARPAPCPRFARRWRGPRRRSRRRSAPTPYPAKPQVNYPARFICTFTAQAPGTSLRSCGANCRKPRATLARPNDAKGGPASTWHGGGA